MPEGEEGVRVKPYTRGSEEVVSLILDEIALEGLEGLTLQALWVRLQDCSEFILPIDPDTQNYVWNIVKQLEDVSFYELPSERPPLVVFNRYDNVDPELGTILEPENVPVDIYPHCAVEDTANGIFGSCVSYFDRRDITSEVQQLSLEEAKAELGSRLVMVASQNVRNIALKGEDVDPSLEISVMQYCILERIGRSRYLGETTQGKLSLQKVGVDPKSLFYHRKFLQHNKLITKQVFHQKSHSFNCSGSLLHLPRFYMERKPKAFFLTERVVELLRSRPKYRAEYEEVRRQLGLSNSLKKLFKTFDFQRFVKTDVKIPYRELYPNATRNEWKHKGSEKEKMIRVMELIRPDVNVSEIWMKDDEYEEDDEGTGFLTELNHFMDLSLLTQAYRTVEEAGPDGVSQMELARTMGQTKLHSRTLCRNLLRRGLVSTFMKDVGRQRVSRFCCKKFEQDGVISQQFRKEREKMLEFMKGSETPKRSAETINADDEPPAKMPKLETAEGEAPAGVSLDESRTSREVDPLGQEAERAAAEVSVLKRSESGDTTMEVESLESSFESPKKKAGAKRTVQVATEGQTIVERFFIEDSNGLLTEIIVRHDPLPTEKKEYSQSFTDEIKTMFSNQKKETRGVTVRVLKRANLIMEAVRTHKVFEDLTKLQKLIKEEEDKEGCETKMDRKSLQRLVAKLSQDGHIKIIKITIKAQGKEKTLNFVCEPHITTDHSVIQSAVEQARMKIFIPNRDKLNEILLESQEHRKEQASALAAAEAKLRPGLDRFELESIHHSIDELQAAMAASASERVKIKRSQTFGKKYGYQPKCVRMKIFHQLLFYIVHDYTGDPDLDQEKARTMLAKSTVVNDELVREISHIYKPVLDWRMFIPPLPVHAGWPHGWTIMCDVLLRLPLSIFMCIVNINYEVPGLMEYLNHPIRKHFLVKHMPPKIRNRLTAARRYIFSAHEVVQRLCYIGLTQFGPQRLKEKDQVFVYVNTRASLLDTTTSPPGYHQVAENQEYKEIPFYLKTASDVDRYWYDLWNICVHTSLGGRTQMEGKNIVLEVLENKDAMLEATQPRSPEEALELDTGMIPGDHRGAAGLDSAFFAHLKRNWHWSSLALRQEMPPPDGKVYPIQAQSERIEKLKKVQRDTLTFESPVKKSAYAASKSVRNPRVPKATTGPKKAPRPSATATATTPSEPGLEPATERAEEPAPKPSVMNPPRKKSLRKDKERVVPFRRASKRKPYYDSTDLTALTLMSKLRVEWTPLEDNLVLLCKVAAMYLCPNPRQQPISMQIWRDILHAHIPYSRNKTSRAVQRRILYMMKNASTVRSVSLCLEELRQDARVKRDFGNLLVSLKAICPTSEEFEKQITEKFRMLVKLLQGRFKNMRSQVGQFHEIVIPDTTAEFSEKFSMVKPAQTVKKSDQFEPVKTVTDIHSSVINALIYSSLSCVHDKTSWAYHLFNVYEQYPDSLLRATMAKIRNDHMVSLRKSYARTKMRAGNYLPLSNCPYQLSIRFFNLLQTRYQYEIYHESFTMVKELIGNFYFDEEKGIELKVPDGGASAAIVEYTSSDLIDFNIIIPDQLIVLDPRISQKDESYARIVERYRDILRSCKVGRDVATSSVLFRKPYMDFLDRDEFWETENDSPDKKERKKADSGVTDDEEEQKKKKKEPKTASPAGGKLAELRKPSTDQTDAELGSESEDENAGENVQRNQQNAVARAASRIALYLMREDIGDAHLQSGTQHAHDFFVVNSCQVECRLKAPEREEPMENVVGRNPDGRDENCQVPSSLVSLSSERSKRALTYVQSKLVYNGLSMTEEELHRRLADEGHDALHLHQILVFLANKEELGANVSELLERFPREGLLDALGVLISFGAVLRSGVTRIVFVHYSFAHAWLIRSKKLNRRNRDKLSPLGSKAVGFDMEDDEGGDVDDEDDFETVDVDESSALTDPEKDQQKPDEEQETDKMADDTEKESQGNEETGAEASESNSNLEGIDLVKSRTKRGSTRVKKAAEPEAQSLDAFKEIADQVLVIMRPWVRVDGTLNRRVLDRFLGAVLGHCLSYPGLSLSKICDYFDPALQPVHTRELLEILQILGSVKWSVLHRSHKPSLFSRPVKFTVGEADGLEKESDILVEPQVDAVTRLGHFIGDKSYSKDLFRNMFGD